MISRVVYFVTLMFLIWLYRFCYRHEPNSAFYLYVFILDDIGFLHGVGLPAIRSEEILKLSSVISAKKQVNRESASKATFSTHLLSSA
jgi:hypothetical protein